MILFGPKIDPEPEKVASESGSENRPHFLMPTQISSPRNSKNGPPKGFLSWGIKLSNKSSLPFEGSGRGRTFHSYSGRQNGTIPNDLGDFHSLWLDRRAAAAHGAAAARRRAPCPG